MDELSTYKHFSIPSGGTGPGLVEAKLIPENISVLVSEDNDDVEKEPLRTIARIAYDNVFAGTEPENWHPVLTLLSDQDAPIMIFIGLENMKRIHNLIGEFLAGKPPQFYVDNPPE